jgi:hypothetical protein
MLFNCLLHCLLSIVLPIELLKKKVHKFNSNQLTRTAMMYTRPSGTGCLQGLRAHHPVVTSHGFEEKHGEGHKYPALFLKCHHALSSPTVLFDSSLS